jgi:hypothetical protein
VIAVGRGPGYMLSVQRCQYLKHYMKEYRRDPTKRDGLKKAHRLDSLKWRLSMLLGPQYTLLFFVQYEPIEWDEQYGVPECSAEGYPVLEWFWTECYSGGGELFKVFVLMRCSRRYDRITDYVIGVLDKAALLKNLQRLTGRKRKEWNGIIEHLEVEARKEKWRELDFSDYGFLQLEKYMYCRPLKWTARKRPDWKDAGLRDLLYRWKDGHRRFGHWERFEMREGNQAPRRGMFSPIFV